MSPSRSIRTLAVFILLAGCATIYFLIFVLAVEVIFRGGHSHEWLLLFLLLLGPAPLFWGPVLSLFEKGQRAGVRITLGGSVILTVYLLLGYINRIVQDLSAPAQVLLPVLVFAVDSAAYGIYRLSRLTNPPAPKSFPPSFSN